MSYRMIQFHDSQPVCLDTPVLAKSHEVCPKSLVYFCNNNNNSLKTGKN